MQESRDFVAGYFRDCYDKWVEIGANVTVLDWIKSGVTIPWKTVPTAFELPNRGFTDRETKFIDSEISLLLHSGAIKQCDKRPLCVSPISCVPKKNSSFRLITDLREVNQCCTEIHFQYENIETTLQSINQGDNLVTFDVKNGFQHVPVCEEQQTFLGFCWRNIYYCWQVLPFGLSLSPYFFHKCIREAVKHLRLLGLRVSAYVDDFIQSDKLDVIISARDLALKELLDLGFFINFEKSSLLPETQKEHVGYIISTVNGDGQVWIRIPHKCIRKLKHDIRRLLVKGSGSARQIARVAGQCVSMSRAIVPAKLLLRNIYKLLRQRTGWSEVLSLSPTARTDLEWWIQALDFWNGAAAPHRVIDIQMVTDASSVGWGGHCLDKEAQGFWSSAVSRQSSNYREMLAILLCLVSFKTELVGKTVQVLTDNVSAVAYINMKGGPSQDLSDLAKSIWSVCLEMDINIIAKHLAGTDNMWADSLSRLSPLYEWKLHPRLWEYLDRRWGPHTVDRFSSMPTALLPRYNSRFLDPKTEGVDALAQQNWETENNFVNPPFRLLPQILDTIVAQKAWATVIAPWWPTQVWFGKLQRMSVVPPIRLPKSRLCSMQIGTTVEPMRNHKWRIFAWRVCGGNV